jgi:hypothetical protein
MKGKLRNCEAVFADVDFWTLGGSTTQVIPSEAEGPRRTTIDPCDSGDGVLRLRSGR